MSLSGKVMEVLVSASEDDLHAMAAKDISERINDASVSGSKVSQILASLEHSGRIALVRDGRNVVGVERIIRAESLRGGGSKSDKSSAPARATQARQRTELPRGLTTPEIDAYERSKAHAEALRNSEDGKYLEIVFRDSPMAEEGLKLKNALADLFAKYQDLSTEYRAIRYEYETHMEQKHRKAAQDRVVEAKQQEMQEAVAQA